MIASFDILAAAVYANNAEVEVVPPPQDDAGKFMCYV